MVKLGPRGEALIKSYETLRLTAYKPTPNDVWTIGWGHTKGVKEGDTCTEVQAQAWFEQDVQGAERVVDKIGAALTESMVDALVSLVYNAGSGALQASIGKNLKARRYYDAWDTLPLWRKQAGKDLLGLARRRAREMVLFLEDGLPK